MVNQIKSTILPICHIKMFLNLPCAVKCVNESSVFRLINIFMVLAELGWWGSHTSQKTCQWVITNEQH